MKMVVYDLIYHILEYPTVFRLRIESWQAIIQ